MWWHWIILAVWLWWVFADRTPLLEASRRLYEKKGGTRDRAPPEGGGRYFNRPPSQP